MRLFVRHDVRFLLIGGYAVNAHGYSRNTSGMDVWVARDAGNQERAVDAMRQFGYPTLSSKDFSGDRTSLRLGVSPLRIGVFKWIADVDFEDCWVRRLEFAAGDLMIPMISREDLIRNKLAAGRPKDLLDVDELS
ncbi:MAG: hypothetical protein U0Q16_07995 [Bryobacteraceae bacterium]